MKSEISETWTIKKTADEVKHLTACNVCRERLRPREDQKLYAVKNARTRQFVHVLINGRSLEDTIGWPKNEILYSLLLEDGAAKGPPMTEEIKERLRVAAAERKLKKSLRANTPARLAEGEQESEDHNMGKAKTKSIGRIFVFDLPVTRVLLWMGKNQFTLEQATAGLEKVGVAKMPHVGTIRAHLTARRVKNHAESIAELTKEQEKILFDAAKSVLIEQTAKKEKPQAKSKKSFGKKAKAARGKKKSLGLDKPSNIAAQVG